MSDPNVLLEVAPNGSPVAVRNNQGKIGSLIGQMGVIADIPAVKGTYQVGNQLYVVGDDGVASAANKLTNIPEICLAKYRAIPNATTRKIAWVGDSTTQQLFIAAAGGYSQIVNDYDFFGSRLTDSFFITTIVDGGVNADILTSDVAHGMYVGSYMHNHGGAVNGLTNNATYKVASVPSANTFTLTDLNGVPVTTLTPGSALSIYAGSNSYVKGNLAYPSGPYYNVKHYNFGENGQTLANFVNGLAANSVNTIAAVNPNLVILSYGINDVRLGATSKDALKSLLTTAVTAVQAKLPSAEIILRMPNSLMYDAANTNGYIDAPTSLAKVQSYSDILRLAYRELIGVFNNCYILDTQKGDGGIFPEGVQSAVGTFMADALHPSGSGYAAIMREIANVIGNYGNVHYSDFQQATPLLPTAAKITSAQATSISANDYLIYPRVCEDTDKYNLLASGNFVGGAAGSYLDFQLDNYLSAKNLTGVIATNDIFVQYAINETASGPQNNAIDSAVTAFMATTLSITTSGNQIRFLSMPAGYPVNQATSQKIKIYRPRPATQANKQALNFSTILSAATFAATTLSNITQNFCVIYDITALAATAPTTGGTISINKNGVTIATLTFANNATVPTYSGTFFTDGTRGAIFAEGDIITAVINAGFVGGSLPKIVFKSL